MNHRKFEALNRNISEVGIGTWQLGGSEWGDVSEESAFNTLEAAADAGVNLIDTADIYGVGRSESLIGKFLARRSDRERFTILTKLGRHPEPGWPENFKPESIVAHTENSLKRLGVESLDLMQTHCVPDQYLEDGTVWQTLRDLQQRGKIRAFGASVESVDEAVRYLDVEGLASLQIIFNIFRQKPIEALFKKAAKRKVALVIRLPLASGLLSGKFSTETSFDQQDHRSFNEDGDAFNVGETFAGLGLANGVFLADQLKSIANLKDARWSMAQWAIRWCLDFPEVTTVIPGATRPDQATANAAASEMPPLSDDQHELLRDFYRDNVHNLIRGKY